MGGFGAVKLALRHPELFIFAGGLSSAIDVPRRAFSIKRLQQSRHYNAIFGLSGSSDAARQRSVCLGPDRESGSGSVLFSDLRRTGRPAAGKPRICAALLAQRHFRFEFHTVPGGHDWNQWNAWLPSLFRSLAEQMNTKELAYLTATPAAMTSAQGRHRGRNRHQSWYHGACLLRVLSRREHRGPLFPEAPVFDEVCECWPTYGPSAKGPQPRPAAGGE